MNKLRKIEYVENVIFGKNCTIDCWGQNQRVSLCGILISMTKVAMKLIVQIIADCVHIQNKSTPRHNFPYAPKTKRRTR